MAMTEREMLNAVINGTITEEVVEKAKERIVALDKRNEKRKSTPSKATLENAEVKKSIIEFLTGKDFTLGLTIAEEMSLSSNKVSSLCSKMAKEDGTLIETEVSVKGKGKRKAYKVA